MRIIIFLIFLFLLVVLSSGIYSHASSYQIDNAVYYGYISVTVKGTGDYYGSSALYFIIYNEKNYEITILIPKGLVLSPDDPSYQNMIVSSDYEVTVPADDYVTLYVAGFCIEIDDEIPTSYVEFSIVGVTRNSDLLKLIEYIDNNNLHDSWDAQLAVWTVSDGPYKVKQKLIEWSIEEGYSYDEAEQVAEEVSLDAQRILDDAGLGYKYKLAESSNDHYRNEDTYTSEEDYYIYIILIIFIISIIYIYIKKK